jgi:hypothetical protein
VAITVDEIEQATAEGVVADLRSAFVMPPTRIVLVRRSLDEVELVPDDEWRDRRVS